MSSPRSPATEAAAIVDICRQVEGLPLALELAAAWMRVLPCEAIVAELRQGTELLRAVDTAHPARHASIEVVFGQSWRLLTAIEREALSRLSVFRGGFSAEAARAIAAASVPVLGALAERAGLVPFFATTAGASKMVCPCWAKPPNRNQPAQTRV